MKVLNKTEAKKQGMEPLTLPSSNKAELERYCRDMAKAGAVWALVRELPGKLSIWRVPAPVAVLYSNGEYPKKRRKYKLTLKD